MRLKTFFVLSAVFLLIGCPGPDPMIEINKHIEAGDIRQAKTKYKAYVQEADNPNIERKYISFLFEQKQYHDFKREVIGYLQRFPQDKEIQSLEFQYYAKLATDAERQKNYELALDYIVNKLLSPDFADYRKWESRQTTIFKKWFERARDENNANTQRVIIVRMSALGFDSLAQSLAPDIYADISKTKN